MPYIRFMLKGSGPAHIDFFGNVFTSGQQYLRVLAYVTTASFDLLFYAFHLVKTIASLLTLNVTDYILKCKRFIEK